MADMFLAWELLELENRARRVDRRAEMRDVREMYNPFDLPDDEFIDRFRISPDMAQELIQSLAPYLERARPNGLSVEKQVPKIVLFLSNLIESCVG